MQDERKFLEDLMQQRFNFLLVTFTLLLTAAFQLSSAIEKSLFLSFGSALLVLMWLALYRIYKKVIYALHLIFQEKCATKEVHEAAKKSNDILSIPAQWLIGVLIPLMCICFTQGGATYFASTTKGSAMLIVCICFDVLLVIHLAYALLTVSEDYDKGYKMAATERLSG